MSGIVVGGSVTAVQRAAAHIDAGELADGRWAYYADETCSWFVVSAAELAELCGYLDSDDPDIKRDAYSHWCAGVPGEEQLDNWQPAWLGAAS